MQISKGFRDGIVDYYRTADIPPMAKLHLAVRSGNRRLIKCVVGGSRGRRIGRKGIIGYLSHRGYGNLRNLFRDNLFSSIGTLFSLQQISAVDAVKLIKGATERDRFASLKAGDTEGFALAERIVSKRLKASRPENIPENILGAQVVIDWPSDDDEDASPPHKGEDRNRGAYDPYEGLTEKSCFRECVKYPWSTPVPGEFHLVPQHVGG
jgi:hypothetical protein